MTALHRGERHEFRSGLDAVLQRDRVRGRVGYLGHQPGLHPTLTARETLELFATLHGLERGRAPEALDWLGLGELGGVGEPQLAPGPLVERRHAEPDDPGRVRPGPQVDPVAGADVPGHVAVHLDRDVIRA